MIRNELYTKHLRDISVLAERLDSTLDTLPGSSDEETMEETNIRHALYAAAEKLNDAKRAIEYYSKPTKQGRLRENSSGKFEVDYTNGGSSYPLSSGSSIEVYLNADSESNTEEGWYSGRVEHRQDGYYFFGPTKPSLREGMKVRKRGNE